MKRIINVFCLIYICLNCIYAEVGNAPYCQQYPDSDAINPSLLPLLPGEFSTRIELTVGENRDFTIDMIVNYDSFDNRASINARQYNYRAREIFYYDKNELFAIYENQCDVTTLDNSSNIPFFGVVNTSNGLAMKPPNEVLHFNNGFNYVKGNKTMYRGIPVNHYRSCQEWPEKNASFQIDFYFKKPEFVPGVVFLEDFKETPVATVLEGLADINPVTKEGRKFRNEYNYFEFRTLIDDKTSLYQLPEGLFCEGQTDKQPIPKLPYEFSFTEEIVIDGERSAQTVKVYYAFTIQMARFDVIAPREQNNALDNFKVIHDFHSGISYTIDKESDECRIKPLGNEFLDATNKPSPSGLATSLFMKNPQEMFFLDDTYFYTGERMERGILCDVYISNRTDFYMPNVTVQPRYWVFEIFFMNLKQTNIGSDRIERVTPVALKISAPGIARKYNIHFYDFDSKVDQKDFDYSICFQGKNRVDFGIKYKYPPGITQDNFKFRQEEFIVGFYTQLFTFLEMYSFSPLRIIPPTLVPLNSSLIVYSGVIDSAPPINHFQLKNQTKINIMKAEYKIPSSSAEACAQSCLNVDAFDATPFKCLSFDFCPIQQACVFYNFSLVADPSVESETDPACDHYSKTVEYSDAATKEQIYREIQDLVSRKELNVNIVYNGNILNASYSCEDIFPATLQASLDSSNLVPIGTTSFFKQFLIISFDADFNLAEANRDSEIIVRQRNGISIDECARLCLKEPAFRCETITYQNSLTECKWSSFVASTLQSTSDSPLIVPSDGYTFFIRDPFYDYIQFSSQTTTLTNNKVVDVDTDNQCAYLCNTEKSFNCKSFNLCKNNDKYKCLLSDTHVNNLDKNPNLVYSPICTHYSRNNVDDFKLVAKTQLSVKPQSKYFNTTVESCAQMCTFMDAYVCRSFDFFINDGTCFLYKENLKDVNFPDVYGINNENCSHYSRVYITENGKQIEIIANINSVKKYSGGIIFGVILAVTLLTVLLGFVVGFYSIKKINLNKNLPVMEFVNPNYKKKQEN